MKLRSLALAENSTQFTAPICQFPNAEDWRLEFLIPSSDLSGHQTCALYTAILSGNILIDIK